MRCTILVNSCDTYEDSWNPFFYFLTKNWDDIKYPIVLNTESKSFNYQGLNIRTFNFYKEGKKVSWGRRLKKTLRSIDTEFVLFMLDDFFLLKPVDTARIEQCLDWMEEDKNIAVFSFWRTHGPNEKTRKYPHFEKRPQNGSYRLNCQAAVWRREHLIKYIRSHENPWEWEILGSERSAKYTEEFYSAIEGEPYIMEYDWMSGGAIHRGKWTSNAVKLLKENGYLLDFSKRGIESLEVTEVSKKNERVWDKIKSEIIRKIRANMSLRF